MKRVVILIMVLVSILSLNAQKSNVSKAKNKALMDEPDFVGAREAIKLALQDSTTKNQAETWYVAGLIGKAENEKLYEKSLIPGNTIDQEQKGAAILESYNYLLKADSIGQIPDAKGKVNQRYRRDIKPILKAYYEDPSNLITYASTMFDGKKYEKAAKGFEVYLAIPRLPIMNNEIKIDTNYYKIQYYTGAAAANAELHPLAIKIFNDLKDKKYQTNIVYQLLFNEYQAIKDTVNTVKLLKEVIEKYPKEVWALQNMVNYYINAKKISEAITYLDAAIANDPKVVQYYYVKGTLCENTKKYDDAKSLYEKAIELDPKMADAYAGLGRIYFNKASNMTLEADNLKDNKQIEAQKQEAREIYKLSIPNFKKAIELNSKSNEISSKDFAYDSTDLKSKVIENKKALKSVYYKLGMSADYDAIVKDINGQK
jgi:tetratricopeptide (TPR) repeat protein